MGTKGPIDGDVQGLQEAAERQAAVSACGQELLRSLKRALDLALMCVKTMSDAAEDLSCATENGGQVTASSRAAFAIATFSLIDATGCKFETVGRSLCQSPGV